MVARLRPGFKFLYSCFHPFGILSKIKWFRQPYINYQKKMLRIFYIIIYFYDNFQINQP